METKAIVQSTCKKDDFLSNCKREADVNVCFICDDGYVLYTVVAITSILANRRIDVTYDIYIISSGLSKENIEILESLNDENFSIKIIKIDEPEKYEYLTKEGFPVTPTALFKFDLPMLLPHLNKVLYIDGDVIVQHCLKALFDIDIKDVFAGVVKDYRGLSLKGDFRERLNINHDAYFNSGMMLLNLALMREEDIPNKLLEYRQHGVNYYMDQDALNVVFAEKVKYLSFNFNFQMTCWRFMNEELISNYYYLPRVNDKYELIKKAVIIHYTAEKPWVYYDGKCSEIWMHYYLLSPYKNINLNRKSILTRCKSEADKSRIYQNRLLLPSEFNFELQNPPLISVIMPVYNAEKFINVAISSLKRQSLVDYEVICVNDASTDASLEILNALAEADERIRVISINENRGAGGARNIALKQIRSEFVTFLDADDELPPYALERFYQTAKETNADFIFAQTQFDNKHVLASSYRQDLLSAEKVFSSDDMADYLLSITHGGPSGKCLKASFIKENNLSFPEIARSEDFYFFSCALIQAKRITGICEPLYTVISHANPNSLEHTKDETPLIFWKASNMLKEWMIETGNYEKYERSFINSNIVRFIHNMKALRTFKGIIQLKEYFDQVISKELKLFEFGAEYFYESKSYDEVVLFADKTLEEVLNNFASSKFQKEKPKVKSEEPKKTNQKPSPVVQKTNVSTIHDENYWKGVSDTRASRTYLAGRIITWIPKQMKAFVISIKQDGIIEALKLETKRIYNLPKAIGDFIKVWNMRTPKVHKSK